MTHQYSVNIENPESADQLCRRIGRTIACGSMTRRFASGQRQVLGTDVSQDVAEALERLGIVGYSRSAFHDAVVTGIADHHDPQRGHELVPTSCHVCGDSHLVKLQDVETAAYEWLCAPCSEVESGEFPFGEESHPGMVTAFYQLDEIATRHEPYSEKKVWNDTFQTWDTDTEWNEEFLLEKDALKLDADLLDEWGDDSIDFVHYWWDGERRRGVWPRYKKKVIRDVASRRENG